MFNKSFLTEHKKLPAMIGFPCTHSASVGVRLILGPDVTYIHLLYVLFIIKLKRSIL